MSDLQQQYSLSDISMLTNISLRSLRNYVRMGYISGDMLDRIGTIRKQMALEMGRLGSSWRIASASLGAHA